MRYAELTVDGPTASRGTFSYHIPSHLDVAPGHVAWVPFGPRTVQGLVMELRDKPSVDSDKVRDILRLQDPTPLLTRVQLDLVRWIAERYLAPLFQTALLFLPPASRRAETHYLRITEDGQLAERASFTPSKHAVLDYMVEHRSVTVTALRRALGKGATRALKALEEDGYILRETRAGPRRVKPLMAKHVTTDLSGADLRQALDSLHARGAMRQAEALDLLARETEPVLQADFARKTGASATVIQALQKAGYARVTQRRAWRDPLAKVTYTPTPHLEPSASQKRALDAIVKALRAPWGPGEERTFLVHGITGSGKTEVYLQALAEAVAQGKQGLVLVPEIALTAQTIQRFWERFPGRVAVLHSQLSPGERYDEWWGIKEGLFDVVIGPRSALGAPLARLGIVVMDEEHEPAYKQQDPSPRYHARDVARELARRSGAVLVLGSATPDVETYLRAERGEYRLLELPERVASEETGFRVQPSPEVEVVDMRVELRERHNTGMFSESLRRGLERTLGAGEQAVLFLNRRGTATSVQCRDCGYLAKCPRCSTPLTFHAPDTLSCHQCNRRMRPPRICPDCESSRIRYLGMGTQRVAEEVSALFPQARVLRWDRDTTQGRDAHAKILGKFLRHEADVLVGTQMLAKGLHMPLVSLVGVVNADVGLHLPDFRAGERTYQLLSQVAGRAGRGLSPGRAIVQTYNPEHYALRAVARQSYKEFYVEEIGFRDALGYPPFSRMARLVYAHPSAEAARQHAERFAETLRTEMTVRGMTEIEMIGPAPAFIQRLRGRYRWHLILRGPDPARFLDTVPLPDGWVVDVEPVGVL